MSAVSEMLINDALSRISEECINARKICDNMFFSDYFYKGGNKSPDVTKDYINKIQTEIIETFIDFFGEEYADQIRERVEKFEIDFQYKTCGEKNSIEAFLIDKKCEYVKLKTGYNYNPRIVGDISVCANALYSDCGGDFSKFVSEHGDDAVFKNALSYFGFTSNIDVSNIDAVKQIFDKMRSYQAYSMRYSDIPEVESDMQELNRLVEDFHKDAKTFLRESGRDYSRDALKEFFADEVCQFDEIAVLTTLDFFATMSGNFDRYELLKDDCCVAAETATAYDVNRIRLGGVMCCEETIIHEFVHAITNYGFHKGSFGVKPSQENAQYSSQLDLPLMLDEVITDYIAVKMVQRRKELGKAPISQGASINSSYSKLFPYVEKFMDSCMPVIKKAMMSEKSFENLASVVGEDALNKIAISLNELKMLLHELNIYDLTFNAHIVGVNASPEIINKVITGYDKLSDKDKGIYAIIEQGVEDIPQLKDLMRISRETPELMQQAIHSIQINSEITPMQNNGVQSPQQINPQNRERPPRMMDDGPSM